MAADQADSPNVANNRSELSFDKVSKTESENQSFGDECSNKLLPWYSIVFLLER